MTIDPFTHAHARTHQPVGIIEEAERRGVVLRGRRRRVRRRLGGERLAEAAVGGADRPRHLGRELRAAPALCVRVSGG